MHSKHTVHLLCVSRLSHYCHVFLMARIMLYVAANLLSLSQVECCVKNLFFLNWVKMVSRTSGENYKSPEGQVKKSVSHMEKKNSHVFSQMERNVERLSWQNFFSSSSKVINPGVKITEIRKWPLFSSDLNWSDLSFVQDTDWNWVGEKNSNVLHSISDRKKKNLHMISWMEKNGL